MTRLHGKRVVITGGSTGIGAAVVRRFAAEGAAIAILDVNTEAAEALARDISQPGSMAFAIGCDVGDVAAVADAVEAAADRLGGIDVVMANAAVGTITVGGTVETIDPEMWDLAFDVNTRGVYAVCRAALPHLRVRGGSIVVTSSSSALIGAGGGRPTHAYTAAKGALLSLVRALAVSYGPEGIRVNALVPGFVRTRLTADVVDDPAALAGAIEGIPLRRIAEPDEMAPCALFLASDEASFVTGTMLVADGGQTIQ
ncbi:MAG: SDR family oxidoreductase [Thermomicrobiales bacterium]|nr:SDR family oxidoreductase [Thermomicrobiales bacterium]